MVGNLVSIPGILSCSTPESLTRQQALTSEELRTLSPFDLELGKFSEPVSRSGQDQQLAEATASLEKAVAGIKNFDPLFVHRAVSCQNVRWAENISRTASTSWRQTEKAIGFENSNAV